MAATQESSVALSQQSIFDWVSGCTTRSMANRDLPERKPDQMSKKQKRANQKKNQRKNRQNQQNASRNLSGDLSPPPSPNSDTSRTFSQILNDALPTQNSNSSDIPSPTQSPEIPQSVKDRIAYLEQTNASLICERDLLNDDLNSATKLLDQFKKNNKKLTTDNDNLRRDISKKSGIRKFSCASIAIQTDLPTTLQDTAAITVGQFNSFCDHVSTIAKSLYDDFSNAKISTTPSHTVSHLTPSSTEGFQPVQPRKRYASRSAPKLPTSGCNPIPTIGTRGAPSYAQVASQNIHNKPTQRRPGQGARRRTNKTIILGTSLTDGLSRELNKHGVSSTTHIYRGHKLDLIRERVPFIFSKDVRKQPDNILLLAGGNDAEETTVDLTINSYEGLVRDIRKICPQAKILLSAIPPRKNNITINKKIEEVNDYLKDRGQRNDRLC